MTVRRQFARARRLLARLLRRSSSGRGLFRSDYLDDSTLERVRQRLGDAGGGLGIGGGGTDFDSRRIAITVGYVRRYGLDRGSVVEIGSLEYAAAKALWAEFPAARPRATTNDLRSEPLPFADGSVDSLVCLEVIEHLSDVPYAQATTLSGLFHFLEEVYRVLSVGGRALFTTPNAASYWAITRALRHEPPMMYEWHFREFTVDELRRIFASVGFAIVALETEFVWHLWDFEPLRRFAARHGHGTKDRGDDAFLVVEKRSTRERVHHGLNLPIA